jgi:hypothetical protein
VSDIAVGVCGFGRCGSTMVMAMLDAGGCPPVIGSKSGSYEVSDVSVAMQWPAHRYSGRAIKLLDGIKHYPLTTKPNWRFVWIDRDIHQQARSTAKFFGAIAGLSFDDDGLRRLADSYVADRPSVRASYQSMGSVLTLSYEAVLANPLQAADDLAQLIPGLDAKAAASVVHPRASECRPDLAFELSVCR